MDNGQWTMDNGQWTVDSERENPRAGTRRNQSRWKILVLGRLVESVPTIWISRTWDCVSGGGLCTVWVWAYGVKILMFVAVQSIAV
jgi:hypothetical protein